MLASVGALSPAAHAADAAIQELSFAAIPIPLPGFLKYTALVKGLKFIHAFKSGTNPAVRSIGGRFVEFSVEVGARNKGAGYTRWVKVLNADGRTIKVYHDTFDASGRFVHRGVKVPGPERHVF